MENGLYYGLILLSVVMFGGGFALNDVYRKERGSGLSVSMEAAFLGSLASLPFLFAFNGFVLDFTPFTLIMATLAALNGIGFTFFTFRALDAVNLSLFSVFSMLGGMVLPSVLGIAFYGEDFTVAKAVCTVLIVTALLLTVKREEKSGGLLWCLGVFVLNGMSGVLSKLFNELPFPRTDAASYSIWIGLVTALISGCAWLIYLKKANWKIGKYTLRAGAAVFTNGALNKIANFILVLAIPFIHASVQYPMITGGVMIVTTLICCFGDRKPSKRELLSVLFAFLGTLALFVIPV